MTAQESEKFPYEPLDSTVDTIRLILLHPPREDEDRAVVRCQLIHSEFLSRPKYYALSYTWGNPNVLKRIFVNDMEISVRENLYWALYYLRTTEDRVIWADAICINQSDLEERRYQVGLMAFIYSRAYSVLVWLGRPLDPKIEEIVTWAPSLSRDGWLWLCCQEYWERLWVIQEIGLSMRLNVCIGTAVQDWGQFIRKADRFLNYQRDDHAIFKLDEKRTNRHGDPNRLETLLEDFQYAKCEEARDRIYGFLGLAHDCQDGSLETDYSKSLFDLYTDVIRLFCRRIVLQNGSTNDLDRSMRIVRFSQLVQRLLGGDIKDTTDRRVVSTEVIQARGAIGGTILHLGPGYNEIFSSHDENKRWKNSFHDHYQYKKHIKELRERNEAYGAVLLRMDDDGEAAKVCAIDPQQMYSRGIKADQPWNDDANDWFRQELDNQIGRDLSDSPAVANPHAASPQPRMFLGSNFHMGLVPLEAKEGDLICHFWNCDVVALLRHEDNTSFYRVVGRIHLSTGSLDRSSKPVYQDWMSPAKDAQAMCIQMDINTLSLLTC